MIDLAGYLLAVSVPISTSTRRSRCQQGSVDSLHLGCDSPKAPVLILLCGHSGINQRVTNVVDTTLTQPLIVSIGAARIGVAVDADLGGSDSASCRPRCQIHGLVSLERIADLSKSNRKSLNVDSLRTSWLGATAAIDLRARCSGWTLRAHRAGWAHRTSWAVCPAECRNRRKTRVIECRTDRRKDCAFHPLDFSDPWNTRPSIRLEGVRAAPLTVW